MSAGRNGKVGGEINGHRRKGSVSEIRIFHLKLRLIVKEEFCEAMKLGRRKASVGGGEVEFRNCLVDVAGCEESSVGRRIAEPRRVGWRGCKLDGDVRYRW